MTKTYNILILGASYGSLLATKLALAGHNVHMTCTPPTAALINVEGTAVRMLVKGREGLVEVRSEGLPGRITASVPADADPRDFDLVALAMQEPQYRMIEVRQLMQRIADARVPCISLMNMPPLPYLKRIPGLETGELRGCFTDPALWDAFDPGVVTLCSPDPQAFRPQGEKPNVIQVRLATNFKAARFESDAHTAILRQLERDIDASRIEIDGTVTELPVKLKVHDSLFVPFAKWAMLMTGNYRCVEQSGMRPICDAVHRDVAASKETYDGIVDLCIGLGAKSEDLVPFEKYADAARSLASPSSVARALAAGAPHVERVDKLVQLIASQNGWRNVAVDETVAVVEDWLSRNRALQVATAA